MFSGLFQDFRYGLRNLGRSPGFTVVAALILALGIGANTTIFTVVNGCFFAPPPHVVEPERLVRPNLATAEDSGMWWSHPDFVFFREHNTVFSGMCAYEPDGMVLTAATGGGKQSVDAWYVSENYFDVLGIRPAAGRTFRPEEGRAPGGHAVVVISHGLWQRSFGGQSDVIGSSLRLNGNPFTIVGVAPEHFHGASPIESAPDVYVPLMMQPVLTPSPADWLHRAEDMYIGWLQILGRLEPEVALEVAQAEMDALMASLQEEFPAPKWATDGMLVRLSPHFQFEPDLRSRLVTLTRMLVAVVGVVLIIACANIAILLLVRASARSRDIGVQVALGAHRNRIVRQLLVESLLLSSLGGVGGYLVAFWSADIAARAFPFTFGIDFNPDGRVLTFTLAVSTAAAVLFGIAPAILASRADIVTLIKSRESGKPRSVLRSVLVVAQVAMSIVLVAGAVQFVRSLHHAESVDLGFETERRLLVSLNLTNHRYSQEDIRNFVLRGLERIENLPGVVRAATTLHIPFRGRWGSRIRTEGSDPEEGARVASFNSVSPGYFQTMGIPLMAGRDFTVRDDTNAPLVAVLNEAAARMLWPDGDGLGKTFLKSDERITVVGIAKNSKYQELAEQPTPFVYVPALQPFATFTGRISFLVQTAGEPMSLAGSVKNAIHDIDPDLAFMSVQTIEDAVERVLGRYRVAATVVSLFGLLALVLAVMGLYGVLSYLVVRRTRTIGIQMALGATQGRVARGILKEGLQLSLLGVSFGIPLALASSRFVESFLYDINPKDPVTFFVVALVLTAVACLAGVMPALRASRVNPIDSLREEG